MDKKVNEDDLILEDGKVVPKELRTRCEIWSRPVGYLRPVQLYNKGNKKNSKREKV